MAPRRNPTNVLNADANRDLCLDAVFERCRCQGDLDIGLADDRVDARGRIDWIERDIGAARFEDGEHGDDVAPPDRSR